MTECQPVLKILKQCIYSVPLVEYRCSTITVTFMIYSFLIHQNVVKVSCSRQRLRILVRETIGKWQVVIMLCQLLLLFVRGQKTVLCTEIGRYWLFHRHLQNIFVHLENSLRIIFLPNLSWNQTQVVALSYLSVNILKLKLVYTSVNRW